MARKKIRRDSCVRLRPLSVLGSFGVVLMSLEVNFHVVRSALQNSMCVIKSFAQFKQSKLAPKDLSLDEFKAKISWRYDFEKPPPSIS